MSQEIKLEKLIDVLMRQFEVHGFLGEQLVQQLHFVYDLGWSVGFDAGLDQDLKSDVIATDKEDLTRLRAAHDEIHGGIFGADTTVCQLCEALDRVKEKKPEESKEVKPNGQTTTPDAS